MKRGTVPHNKQLIERMPNVYRNPSATPSNSLASYLVPCGKGSIFEGKEGTAIASITDGTSNTILALEVNESASVVWTKPDDFNFDPTKPLLGVGSCPSGRVPGGAGRRECAVHRVDDRSCAFPAPADDGRRSGCGRVLGLQETRRERNRVHPFDTSAA